MSKVFVDTWAWYALADSADVDHEFSYTDCTLFAVMRALGLTHAFTADHHFAVMGFVLVP